MHIVNLGFPFRQGYQGVEEKRIQRVFDSDTKHLVTWVPELPREEVIRTICKLFKENHVSLRVTPDDPRGCPNPEWEGHFVALWDDAIPLDDGADLQQAVKVIESFNKTGEYDLPSSLEAVIAIAWQRTMGDPFDSPGIVCSDNVVVRISEEDKISILPLSNDQTNLCVFPAKRF